MDRELKRIKLIVSQSEDGSLWVTRADYPYSFPKEGNIERRSQGTMTRLNYDQIKSLLIDREVSKKRSFSITGYMDFYIDR